MIRDREDFKTNPIVLFRLLGHVFRLDLLLTPVVFVFLLMATLGFLAGDRRQAPSSNPTPSASATQKGLGVRSLVFSPDGGPLISVAGFEGIASWDLPLLGRRSLALPNLQSRALALEGHRIAVATSEPQTSGPDQILVLDESSGTVLHTMVCGPETQGINGLAFGPDESLLSCHSEGFIRVWDLNSGQIRREIRPGGLCFSMAVSPDRKLVAVGGDQGRISVWHVGSGHQRTEWASLEPNRTMSIAFLPDGRRLISCEGLTLRLWDLETSRRIVERLGHESEVTSLAVAPDSQTIASGDRQGQIRIWDSTRGELLATVNGHTSQAWALAFSPDGQTLASGGYDHKIHLWNVAELIGPGLSSMGQLSPGNLPSASAWRQAQVIEFPPVSRPGGEFGVKKQ